MRLVLGDGRENVDGEPICVGEVGGDEFEPALHQPRDHLDVAGKTIEPCDDKRCTCDAAEAQRLAERWAVIPASAHGLGKFGDDNAGVVGDVVIYCGTLTFDAEAEPSLATG